MAKVKYYYDPKTLSYRKIEKDWKKRVREWLLLSVGIALFAGLSYLVLNNYIDSPKELRLKRELDQMKFQYELLNKRMNQVDLVLRDLQNRDDNIYRVIFEADPIPLSVRQAGFGGANRYKELEGYENATLLKESAQRLDILTKKLYVQSKSFDEVIKMAGEKEDLIASIPAIQPIANQDLSRIASGFGFRIHPIYKVPKMHTGIDFSAPTGTPIYATGNGTVINDQNLRNSGYGNYVMLDHGFGYQTLYAHVSRTNVRVGQKVKRGDVIAFVGSTGQSTAPHLHYEVIKNGVKVNPINFFFNDLSPEEYDRLIEMASNINQSFD
jgi:murein DD-endopeptidase MepM/ murein hydrolase activator NlpD